MGGRAPRGPARSCDNLGAERGAAEAAAAMRGAGVVRVEGGDNAAVKPEGPEAVAAGESPCCCGEREKFGFREEVAAVARCRGRLDPPTRIGEVPNGVDTRGDDPAPAKPPTRGLLELNFVAWRNGLFVFCSEDMMERSPSDMAVYREPWTVREKDQIDYIC